MEFKKTAGESLSGLEDKKNRRVLKEKKSRTRFFTGLFLMFFASISLGAQPAAPWVEPTASVRAYVYVARPAGAVRADVVWRMPSDFPGKKAEEALRHVAVYRASDGQRVANVYVREISPDRLVIAFEALSAGNYILYGAPYADLSDRAFSRAVWTRKHRPENYPDFIRFPQAETLQIQWRDLPSDDPYAVCATTTEADAYFSRAAGDAFRAYFVPERYPLNGENRLPLLWAVPSDDAPASGGFFSRMFGRKTETKPVGDTVRVSVGEKALVQVGVVGTGSVPCSLVVRYTSAPSAGISLRVVGGEEQSIAPRELRSIWAVVETSTDTPAGNYDLSLRIEGGGTARDVPFTLRVEDAVPDPAGSRRADFLSRIGLKSGRDSLTNLALNPRFPVTMSQGYLVSSGNNMLAINPETALPIQLYTGQASLLDVPMLLVFSTPNGTRKIGVRDLRFLRREGGVQLWEGSVRTHDMDVRLQASLSAYGKIHYDVRVQALSGIDFRNITLEAGFSEQVGQACYDTVCVADGQVVSRHPSEGFSGLWIGGKEGGVFVTVDPDTSNVFYRLPKATVTLYKTARPGLIVGSGPLRMQAGESISLQCSMQMLPMGYTAGNADGRRLLWVEGDTLPRVEEVGRADGLIVAQPLRLLEGRNGRRADSLWAAGVGLFPYLRPFALPADGFPARALASLGYAFTRENAGRTWYFAPQESFCAAMDTLYDEVLRGRSVQGVVLSDEAVNRLRLPEYSLRRTAAGKPLTVLWYEQGFDASLLGYAPWIDAVVAPDILGKTTGEERLARLGGLPQYGLAPSSSGDVLAGLSYGQAAYGVFSDSLSLSWIKALWEAHEELGLEGDSVRFYSEGEGASPVRVSNPFIRVSAYQLADRLVVVCRNTSSVEQSFVPEFDFAALGIERWEVDRLERAAVGALQSEQMYLLGDPIPVDAGRTLVLNLRWMPRGQD